MANSTAAQQTAEVVSSSKGRIQFVGSLVAAKQTCWWDITPQERFRQVSAPGVILPGFVNPHSHLTGYGLYHPEGLFVDVGSFDLFFRTDPNYKPKKILYDPSEDCTGLILESVICQLIRNMTQMQSAGLNDTLWLMAQGFDRTRQLGFQENMAIILDLVSTTRPLVMLDASGHFSYLNSKGIELMNLTCTSDSPLSEIEQQKCNGVFPELAAFEPLVVAIDTLLAAKPDDILERAYNGFILGTHLLRNKGGYTTSTDALVPPNLIETYRKLDPGEVPSFLSFVEFSRNFSRNFSSSSCSDNHFRFRIRMLRS